MEPSVTPNLVRCPRCQRNLDPLCFYPDRSKSNGRKSHCRACSKSACAQWKKNNPDKVNANAANRRRQIRELRPDKGALQDLYWAQDESSDYEQLVDLFGPDYAEKGIRLTKRRSGKLARQANNPLKEIYDSIESLSDEKKLRGGGEAAMFDVALYLKLMNLIFPMH